MSFDHLSQKLRQVRSLTPRVTSEIKGCKRHILTDTQGLWLGVVVTPARRQDRDAAKGFVLLPRRWVVERTFGWLVKARRLVRDHARNPRHHEALVYIAMIGHSPRHFTANPAILTVSVCSALQHMRCVVHSVFELV
jgi:hypothetical protein